MRVDELPRRRHLRGSIVSQQLLTENRRLDTRNGTLSTLYAGCRKPLASRTIRCTGLALPAIGLQQRDVIESQWCSTEKRDSRKESFGPYLRLDAERGVWTRLTLASVWKFMSIGS
jgi:hypothetical protein